MLPYTDAASDCFDVACRRRADAAHDFAAAAPCPLLPPLRSCDLPRALR